jgi:hypothetical protein
LNNMLMCQFLEVFYEKTYFGLFGSDSIVI